MALNRKGERVISSWSSAFSGTYNSPAAGEAGDLLIFTYMSSSKNITLSAGWIWVDHPNNKSSAHSVSIAYKQLTPSDLSTSITISGSPSGGATLTHLGTYHVVKVGFHPGIPGNVSVSQPGSHILLQANMGDNRDHSLITDGFQPISSVNHYTNGYRTYWKSFTDSINYKVNTDSSGVTYTANWTERPSYMIINENLRRIDMFVAHSNDGINFSEFAPMNENALPQSRYLKFKALFSGGEQSGDIHTFEFDQTKPETKVALNEFLEQVGTDIRLKQSYSQEFTKDVSYETGTLFEVSLDMTKFKKITDLSVQ